MNTANISLGTYPPYFETYISKVGNEPIFEALNNSTAETITLLSGLSETQLLHKYAPEKWSIKEVIQHIIDTERIFCYRALSFARGESISLPGYNHDEYVKNSQADERSKEDLVRELRSVRHVTFELFKSFTTKMLDRIGTANEKEISVSAIIYIIVGHEIHHRSIINERYL